jgi:drug/metabolite transporter (DMT)-like permease
LARELRMFSVLLGALMVIGGVVFLAINVIRRGPLSREKHPPGEEPSLEPRRQGGILTLEGSWPGYALIALGILLLLIGIPA